MSSDAFVEEEDRVRAYTSGKSGYIRFQRTHLTHVDTPYLVDAEDFRNEYKCKHCGHEWSEVHRTERKVKEPKSYTGD